MEKTLISFIKYLEIETSFTFNSSFQIATQKFTDPNEGNMYANFISIDDLTVMLIIISTGSKRYKKIKRLEVFYGNEINYFKALSLKCKINSTVPAIPISLTNSILDLSKYASLL